MIKVPGVTDNGRGVRTKMLSETVDLFPTAVELALGETLPKCEVAGGGVSPDACTEGTSLVPLLTAPDTPVKSAAFSTYSRGWGAVGDGAAAVGAEGEVHSDRGRPTASQCLVGGRGPGSGHPNRKKGCVMGYTMLTYGPGGHHEYRYTEWAGFPGPSANFAPRWDESEGVELYNHTRDPGENDNVIADVKAADPALVAALSKRLRAGWAGQHVPAALDAAPRTFWDSHPHWSMNITEPKAQMTATYTYSALHNSEVMARSGNGGMCAGAKPDNAGVPCVEVTTGGQHWLTWPSKAECCSCCSFAQGCGPMKQDWVSANGQYEGAVDYDGVRADKWNVQGNEMNVWMQDAATGEPVSLQQSVGAPGEQVDNYVAGSLNTGPVDAGVFAVPSYCSATALCPGLCAVLRNLTAV